ncbi:adenylate/guanylate cyclase domain-containing protein [Winogradskyella ouciana]|uniref:Tetratricopeptide repeat protein n=1 Tax=Winogradskyella ouciana TaxID=2608631 RepID=A0A7K1G8P7_9FLAO|nr:adenylate/guanylate cyclase domain-containing protein [Winogradskyella ouciana]MTE25650.1 tetratricopeptide repeat protein [Winogradskyella ouciana]
MFSKSTIKKHAIFIVCFLSLFFLSFVYAQNEEDNIYKWEDQETVDRLKIEYDDSFSFGESKIILLIKIVQNETNPDEKLYYSNLLIEETTDEDLNHYAAVGYLQKGNALQLIGEFHEAIEAYFKSKELLNKVEDDDFEELSSAILVSIADTYSMLGNSERAELYYDEAITLLRELDDPVSLASALLNAGDEYYKTNQYNKALAYFAESGKIFEDVDYQIGKAYNKGNIGMVYAKQGKDALAQNYMNEAINILEANEEYYPIAEFLNYMSELYQDENDIENATSYAYRSLDIAEEHHLKDQISNANLQISELLESSGNIPKAFEHYKKHIVYRDSLMNLENIEKIANYEIAQNEAEVELLTQKRKNQRIVFWSTIGVLFLTSLLAYGLFKRHKFVKATNKIIAAEKQRSDDLLLNILPEDTAKELKDKGRVEAKKYPQVTVLFSDFKGFTKYAENLSPEVLVQTIDHYFSKFDLIMEKYDLEKIKTIGDAYMAAGGLNFDNEKHAEHMVLAAKEMNDFVATAKLDDITDATFDIRIGINTGPVVAGVVGTKKFAYDIWGDTVNIAARMESSSEAGRINISEDTYRLVKDAFDCEYRGKLAVKNRGELNMYFVNS